jgi:hypothetical protein
VSDAALDRGRYPLGVRRCASSGWRRCRATSGMVSGTTASSQGRRARPERNAVVLGPGRFLPVAGWCLTVVVVMVVDDAGTGRSQAAGGGVPDLRAFDHIPPCGSGDVAVSVRWERAGIGLAGQILVENIGGRTGRLSEKPWVVPLGADGKQLPVEALTTMEARDQPVILAPGGRAAARSGGPAGAGRRRPGSWPSSGSAGRLFRG